MNRPFYDSPSHHNGFTLIELSVVLVIIGLVAGGVLVGRDMIESSRIRALMSESDQLKTAANTFQLKYSCLPGDCPNITRLGLGTVANSGQSAYPCTNGNNNGLIGCGSLTCDTLGMSNCSTQHAETGNALVSLRGAGLVPNATAIGFLTYAVSSSYPKAGLWLGSTTAQDKNHVFITNIVGYNGAGAPLDNFYLNNALPNSVARAIDDKMDDGNGLSGQVRAQRPNSTNIPEGYASFFNVAGMPDCINVSTGVYNTSNYNYPICALRLQLR